MRALPILLIAAVTALALAQAPDPQQAPENKPLFNLEGYRPLVALHPIPATSSAAFVTVSGVVFSRVAIDRVTVGQRQALLRPAEPDDLVKLEKAPEGASDAPLRTYFEVPDAGLPRVGANELEMRAHGTDGRSSDLHQVTVIRVAAAEPAAQAK